MSTSDNLKPKKKMLPNTFGVQTISDLNVVLLQVSPSINRRFLTDLMQTTLTVAEPVESEFDKMLAWRIMVKILGLRIEYDFRDKKDLLKQIKFNGEQFDVDKFKLLQGYAVEDKNDDWVRIVIRNFEYTYTNLYLNSKAPILINSLEAIKSKTYPDYKEHMSTLQSDLESTLNVVKRVTDDLDNTVISEFIGGGGRGYLDTFTRIDNKLCADNHKLKSGLQLFDSMTNGGFENARVYLVVGVPKGWKSGFMLNAAIWAKRYNKLKSNRPGMTPAVLYLTLENDVSETMERIWSHSFTNNSNYKDYSTQQHIDMLVKAGIFPSETDTDSAAFIVRYKSSGKINANDIEAIIEEYLADKIDVRFLIVDYVKQMHSVERKTELRLELGQIAFDLKNVAVKYDIPILTGMQFNRGAIKIMEEAGNDIGSMHALAKRVGSSDVSESIDLIMNVDFAAAVLTSDYADGELIPGVPRIRKMLTVRQLASRIKEPLNYSVKKIFSYNFAENNTMRLEEDAGQARCLGFSDDAALNEYNVNAAKAPTNTRTGGRSSNAPVNYSGGRKKTNSQPAIYTETDPILDENI